MRKQFIILLYLGALYATKAQEPLHNYGNLKIHENGAIGFYSNLINDGITDENQGLAGFYSTQSQWISGAFRPIFRDMEILVGKDLFLEVGVGITNNTNFIFGNVITPRSLLDINLNYIDQAFYTGDTNLTKVDGYASLSSKQDFIFPIGYEDRLRPLEILAETPINEAKSAYFFENPNTPTTFDTSFDTLIYEDLLTAVSTIEFWDLDTEIASKVRISWTSESQIDELTSSLENLRVVGWHSDDKEWKSLGNIAVSGNLIEGNITSDSFIPDNYSIITFGGGFNRDDIQLVNYFISPNNDGTNDFLVFKEISLSPNNQLDIYNRWGRLVYTVNNYTNTFQGKANVYGVVKKKDNLPPGVYYYILDLSDIDILHQGYLYLNE